MAELDDDYYVELLGVGHIDTLPLDDDDDDEDLELEQAIDRARRAGGVELELGVGFVRVTRRRRA